MKLTDLRDILHYVPQFREKIFILAVDGDIVTGDNFPTLLLDVDTGERRALPALPKGVVTLGVDEQGPILLHAGAALDGAGDAADGASCGSTCVATASPRVSNSPRRC